MYNNDFKKQDTILRRFKSPDENLFIRQTLVSALFHLLVEQNILKIRSQEVFQSDGLFSTPLMKFFGIKFCYLSKRGQTDNEADIRVKRSQHTCMSFLGSVNIKRREPVIG